MPTTTTAPTEIQLDTIEDALEEIRNGRMIIVVDDENRENEGDLLMAAEHITPESVNYMAKIGRGLICMPINRGNAERLGLDPMVKDNTDPKGTAFTVSVDYKHDGVTTGISAHDRAKTIRAMIDTATTPADLTRPGHIFPLVAVENGVIRRPGHTEAAIDFPRLAGLKPAGVIVEIMNEDGSMARLPQLRELADEQGLKLVSIEDLIAYRLQHESLVKQQFSMDLPTDFGTLTLYAYSSMSGEEELHIALVRGEWAEDEAIPVRVHSASAIGDLFTSSLNQEGGVLRKIMQLIAEREKGVLLYLNQHVQGRQLYNQLKAFVAEANGEEKQSSGKMDNRDYGVGAQILRDLGVRNMQLITNNPVRRAAISGFDLHIVDSIPYDA